MKRLFLAIPLSPEFEKALRNLRDSHGRIPYLRWMPEDNLHITTLFLGEVKEEYVEELISQLKEQLKEFSSFSLKLKKVDYAPPGKPPRMVWAYFESVSVYLELVKKCVSATKEAIPGIELDEKYNDETSLQKLRPHITLARFRKDVMLPRELKRIGKTKLEGEDMPVSEVLLMESVRYSKGAEYNIVEKIHLD